MPNTSRIHLDTKFHAAAAAVAVATAAAITPVVAHAVPAAPAAPVLFRPGAVLTWGFDQLDTALIAGNNKSNPRPNAATNGSGIVTTTTTPAPAPNARANANANANASAAATPGQLIQYLVQGIADGIAGIARGVVVIGGTIAYVGLAFTGGIITAVGNFLPGPLGDIVTNLGTTVNNVANAIAQAIHVGPYATSAV